MNYAAPLAFGLAYLALLILACTAHPAAHTAACLAPLTAWAALALTLARLGRRPQ